MATNRLLDPSPQEPADKTKRLSPKLVALNLMNLPNTLLGFVSSRRMAIARGMALGSKIILMDEPFAALDAITRNQMSMELVQIKEWEKLTILFITHNIQEAIMMGNRILVISKNGTIQEQIDNPIKRPVSPASEGYGKLWQRLYEMLTNENMKGQL